MIHNKGSVAGIRPSLGVDDLGIACAADYRSSRSPKLLRRSNDLLLQCSSCSGCPWKWAFRTEALAKSSYRVDFDAESCSGCGVCEERCLVGAFHMHEDSADYDAAACIGCGLCVSTMSHRCHRPGQARRLYSPSRIVIVSVDIRKGGYYYEGMARSW
jgi:Fe-S-cluster-containing hydrogenase component 2